MVSNFKQAHSFSESLDVEAGLTAEDQSSMVLPGQYGFDYHKDYLQHQ
jgi:hypothetical protein